MVGPTSGLPGSFAMERGETPGEERQSGHHVLPTNLESDSLKKSNWGFLFTGIIGGALVTVYAVATPFITPALRKVCLPFVPATSKQIENVVKMLQHRRGSLVDIGSGDGRIVIAAAKEGFPAVGYELNPWLVWYSRYRAWREGVHGSAKFYISDLWKVTFAQYSNVVVFGVPQMETNLAHIRCDYLWSSQDFLRRRGHFPLPAANALLAVGFEHSFYSAASPSILPRCMLDSGRKPGVGRPAFLFLLAGPGVRCFLESSFGSSAYFHVAVSPHVWNCLGSSPPSNASRDLFLSSWGPSSQFWLFHKPKLCFSCPGLMS
uniref:ATP synthase subunit C lysine N-methyltransferase isoform X1 n=1 Tax=Myodes glareolus TaxID=447135 RepID=UPI002021B257|nr:ATP synthase subunit C lysine N-methyltransferase isoform X1 [Myodes glareolus]